MLLIFLLTSLQAKAGEKFFSNSLGEKLIAFQQNQLWFVKVIRFNSDRWPELIEQKEFKLWSQVENFVQQKRFVTDFSQSLEFSRTVGAELRQTSLLENSENAVLWIAENQSIS